MDESKRQLWEERFEEQANSGMTVDAWCTLLSVKLKAPPSGILF